MPTFERTARFDRDLRALTPEQRRRFTRAARKFVADLEAGAFRAGLRVKKIEGADGIFEMTFAPDGRATFEFGDERFPDEPHVIWRRVGTHDILRTP